MIKIILIVLDYNKDREKSVYSKNENGGDKHESF